MYSNYDIDDLFTVLADCLGYEALCDAIDAAMDIDARQDVYSYIARMYDIDDIEELDYID